MMKGIYQVRPNLKVEFEADNQKELFEAWANCHEVMSHNECGECGKSNIKPQVRINNDNKFYELVCKDCKAVFALGAHKKNNTLFPKVFEIIEENGEEVKKWLPDGGWMRWDKEAGKRV